MILWTGKSAELSGALMLKDCAWREVTTMWAEELEERPKLCVLKELVSGDSK